MADIKRTNQKEDLKVIKGLYTYHKHNQDEYIIGACRKSQHYHRKRKFKEHADKCEAEGVIITGDLCSQSASESESGSSSESDSVDIDQKLQIGGGGSSAVQRLRR